MKTSIIAAALLLIGFQSFAQDKDPKAKAELDEVSKKVKGYTSFSVEFSSNLKTKDGGSENQSGKATIKGNKYIIETGEQKIISDGKTVWTILVKEKEVYENPAEDDDDELMNPTKMFSIWEKDFKYKWVKEETVNGATLVEIHLFPVSPAKSKFHTVIIKINKATHDVNSVTVKGKEGDVLTYKLVKLTPNVNVNDADFKFDKAKYPGYTVIK
ncbi:MAG: outer membrane lipoprotein carrier protein LolA [Flavobacteriales bacterium]|nr:outer membrane lipoprotein carrier protein LolA [Flavobacteriales bacterium]